MSKGTSAAAGIKEKGILYFYLILFFFLNANRFGCFKYLLPMNRGFCVTRVPESQSLSLFFSTEGDCLTETEPFISGLLYTLKTSISGEDGALSDAGWRESNLPKRTSQLN